MLTLVSVHSEAIFERVCATSSDFCNECIGQRRSRFSVSFPSLFCLKSNESFHTCMLPRKTPGGEESIPVSRECMKYQSYCKKFPWPDAVEILLHNMVKMRCRVLLNASPKSVRLWNGEYKSIQRSAHILSGFLLEISAVFGSSDV
jgi:hypothetical protein